MPWIRGFVAPAFVSGTEGRRRIVLIVLACVYSVGIPVGQVLAGDNRVPELVARVLAFGFVLVWLIFRQRPTAAEWAGLWTLLIVAWVGSQLAVGPQYNGVFAVNGVAFLVVVALTFDAWLTAYLALGGFVAYSGVQLHFHSAGHAAAAILMFGVAEAMVVLLVRGTAQSLRESLRNIQELHGRMAESTDLERARIAGELHDDTVQALTAAGLRLDTLSTRLQRGDLAGVESIAREVRLMVDGAAERTRRLSFDLYPAQLEQRGLRSALDALGGHVAGEAHFEVEVLAPDTRYPAEVERLAYRTIRELVFNARKHAEPSRVRISVADHDSSVRCVVEDDGRGFDASDWDASRADSHMGLDSSAERVRMAGGDFAVESQPSRGTRIGFTLPIA